LRGKQKEADPDISESAVQKAAFEIFKSNLDESDLKLLEESEVVEVVTEMAEKSPFWSEALITLSRMSETANDYIGGVKTILSNGHYASFPKSKKWFFKIKNQFPTFEAPKKWANIVLEKIKSKTEKINIKVKFTDTKVAFTSVKQKLSGAWQALRREHKLFWNHPKQPKFSSISPAYNSQSRISVMWNTFKCNAFSSLRLRHALKPGNKHLSYIPMAFIPLHCFMGSVNAVISLFRSKEQAQYDYASLLLKQNEMAKRWYDPELFHPMEEEVVFDSGDIELEDNTARITEED
jgi:hypothetical protein